MKKVFAVVLVLMMMLSCVVVTSAADTKSVNIAGMGTVTISQMSPVGGGNRRFPRVIIDGMIPTKDDPSIYQWDTYRGGTTEGDAYFGVTFEKEFTITAVDFTEGLHFANGGWFANGDIGVEVLVGTEWKPVTLTNTPNYPNSNKMEDFGEPFETYKLTFAPTACLGVRVIGAAGGEKFFSSCAELAVWADVPANYEVVDPWLAERAANAKTRYETSKYLEGYANPICNGNTYGNSGGSHTPLIINDGVKCTPADDAGSSHSKQYDTYNPNTKINLEEYIGYTFDAPYKVEKLIYQSGKIWDNGGWFGFGVYVEALIHGEWVELKNVDTEYPESNTKSDFTSYTDYEIDFEDVVCEGIRLIGIAGGTKNFISCTELTVVGDMNPDLTDYNASAGQQPGGDAGDEGDDKGEPSKPSTDKKDDETTKAVETTKAPAADAATTAAKAEEKKGCGSVIGMSALAMVAILGGAVLVKKKED